MALRQQQDDKEEQLLALAGEVAKAGEASRLGLKERLALLQALSTNITTISHSPTRLIPRDLDLEKGSADAIMLHVNAVELLMAAGGEGTVSGTGKQESGEDDAWSVVLATWVETVGLPILTSRRLDLGPVQNAVGMRLARGLVSASGGAPQTAMETAALMVLDDMSVRVTSPGAERDGELLEVIGAQAGWIASFTNGRAQNGESFPLTVLERTLANLAPSIPPSLRSIIVRAMSPALANLLQGMVEESAAHGIYSKVWAVIRRLDAEGGLEEQVSVVDRKREGKTHCVILRLSLSSHYYA